MNLGSIKNAITSRAGLQLLKLRKHSPAILFVAGTIGVATTVVLACRATLKVDEILDEHTESREKMEALYETRHPDYPVQEFKQDLVKLYVQTSFKMIKLYGPSIVTGVASIAALTGAHVILNRRNVAVTAAYAALDRAYREYRTRVEKELGPEKERELYGGVEVAEVAVESEDGNVVLEMRAISGRSPYARCFDKVNSRSWSPDPGYNQSFLRAAQGWANNLLRARGYVFLNEVHEMLGMSHTKAGQIVGWVVDSKRGDNYIDFGVFDGDLWSGMQFVKGNEQSVWLDFNVDGVVYDCLPEK